MQWSRSYRLRRLQAYAHYLRGPFVAFLPLLLTLIALLLLGGYCFQHYYRHERPNSHLSPGATTTVWFSTGAVAGQRTVWSSAKRAST